MPSVDPRRLANAIRFLSMDAIERAGEGHPGTPLGAADIVTALFTRHLKFNAADPLWFDRDRFVQSNGHGSMLIYSLLHLSGYEAMTLDQLRRFRTLGAHTAGHPEIDQSCGIEVTTGLLGQGIANAAGMALAEAFLNSRFGDGIIDHRTYALVGDGCLQEGVGQEVIALAGHLRLGKLTFLWDDNRITDDGGIDLALSDDMAARFRASNWHVQEVDGHDIDAVSEALRLARLDPRPSMIACTTVIGRGLPHEGQRAAHSARLSRDHTDAARAALGWPAAPFEIPEDVGTAWREAGRRGAAEQEAWRARVEALPADRRREFDRLREGRLPDGWAGALHAFKRRMAESGHADHGYKISGDIVELMTEAIPEMLSGAPDLEGATLHKRRLAAFTADDRAGRYVHYGVREHAMGSMLNGMAAHGGVVASGITYLAFCDYERPAIRMAALMGLPVIFAFSHDSIGIGTNGPTHQPVEVLAALRAIPNLLVLRPADAVEAAECWEIALEHRSGPTALVFARQPLEPVRRGAEPEDTGAGNLCRRGGYVLAEADGGPRRATLLATGSEVAVALQARTLLQEAGVPTAVVSMPCWELFERQEPAYRRSVIDRSTVRVAVEAAVVQGWERYIGEDGGFVGMTSFGASGPAPELYRHFGITPERVAEAVRTRL